MISEQAAKILDAILYAIILATVAVVPVFFDASLVNSYIIPKQYVFSGLTLIAALLWAVRTAITKKIVFYRSILDWKILALVLLGSLSAVFSQSRYDSFLGRGDYFAYNFIFLIVCALFYYLAINQINSKPRWKFAYDALLAVGSAVSIIFLTKYFFPGFWQSSWLANISIISIDNSTSALGLWAIIIFILAGGRIIKKKLSLLSTALCFAAMLLQLGVLFILGYSFLWWMLLASIGSLLFAGIYFLSEARLWWMSTLFALLITVIIFITFGAPSLTRVNLPAEVSLGQKFSWHVAGESLASSAKNFILGSGLGTFGVEFSKFRPLEFNNDPLAWNLRFNQAYSSIITLITEAGAAFTVFLLFIVFFVAGHVFFAWYKMRSEMTLQSLRMEIAWKKQDLRLDIFLMFIAWFMATAGLFTVFYGVTLWWLWWFMLIMSISSLSFLDSGIIKIKKWEIEDAPQYSLSFSFIMIVVLAAICMSLIIGAKYYSAESNYSHAKMSGNINTAKAELEKAVQKRLNYDVYHAFLAQAYLLEAGDMAKKEKPDTQAISLVMAKAVNEAKRASELSPQSPAMWENLSTMYENAAALVPSARDWALKSLSKAKELEPSNAVLSWRLGNNYSALGQWDEAIKKYQEAIDLKKDYLAAYSGIAFAYEQAGQMEKAVEIFEKIFPGITNNPELLYQYGRLLFNRGRANDLANAEKLWLAAIEIQPDFSNALYSLGLLYEKQRKISLALQYYKKVAGLNPNNNDIAAKIKSLSAAPANKSAKKK